MMELPPRLATADWALESAFAQAAAASSAEGDSLFGNVRIRFAPPGAAKDSAEVSLACKPCGSMFRFPS